MMTEDWFKSENYGYLHDYNGGLWVECEKSFESKMDWYNIKKCCAWCILKCIKRLFDKHICWVLKKNTYNAIHTYMDDYGSFVFAKANQRILLAAWMESQF